MNSFDIDKKNFSLQFDEEKIKSSQPFIHEYEKLMAYYRCAIMEIETKFNVLNEEFSLANDRNHIESIKVRLKSMDSILEKLHHRSF